VQVIEADPTGLKKRENALYAAMDRIGTDESAVFEALHGLTPKMGAALEQYWKPVMQHKHDLRWWLHDELSGDEEDAAVAYLDGNPALGARYEIAASLHWYGDDVKQIESALRALTTPGQLEKLKNDPGFEAVNKAVQLSLHGTNLDVTNALLAGPRGPRGRAAPQGADR